MISRQSNKYKICKSHIQRNNQFSKLIFSLKHELEKENLFKCKRMKDKETFWVLQGIKALKRHSKLRP